MSAQRFQAGRAPGPGPGAEPADARRRQTLLAVRIALVATIVLGQLWALTIALDAHLLGEDAMVRWLLGFQVVSTLLALGVWRSTPGDR